MQDHPAMNPVQTTLVYCVREGSVLLAKRGKSPFEGMWVAPGGKLEAQEAPWECAERELFEETGLRAGSVRLRGIVSEVSPRPDWQWMLFIYLVNEFSGTVESEKEAVALRWWSISDVAVPHIPPSDAIFFPRIMDQSAPLYEARYTYDEQLRLVQVIERAR